MARPRVVAGSRSAVGDCVGDVGVGRRRRRGDEAVLDVVLDLVVAGELPAAVAEREQERGDAERDDDGGERQRLRQRVGEVAAGRPCR